MKFRVYLRSMQEGNQSAGELLVNADSETEAIRYALERIIALNALYGRHAEVADYVVNACVCADPAPNRYDTLHDVQSIPYPYGYPETATKSVGGEASAVLLLP